MRNSLELPSRQRARRRRRPRSVIARYYRRDAQVETKADKTPVTIADREAEREIRRVLEGAFPGHGYFGEELGTERGGAEFLWLIDPIDGTKSFVRGYPFFSTQIALMHRGEIVLGVSSAASSARRWARARRRRLPQRRARPGPPPRRAWTRDLRSATSRPWRGAAAGTSSRGWCALRTAPAATATSTTTTCSRAASIDAVVESDVNILDIAALVVIVREAGGVFTDLDGATSASTRPPCSRRRRLRCTPHACIARCSAGCAGGNPSVRGAIEAPVRPIR